MTALATSTWVDICPVDDLVPGRGAAALVAGTQVALFLLPGGTLRAIDNFDPLSGANVLSRGILGSLGDRTVVASPIHKQHIDLDTGEYVEDPAVVVRTWPVRVLNGRIQVST